MVQWIVVALIVIAAAVTLVRRLWRSSSPDGCASCGDHCAECPSFPVSEDRCPRPPSDPSS